MCSSCQPPLLEDDLTWPDMTSWPDLIISMTHWPGLQWGHQVEHKVRVFSRCGRKWIRQAWLRRSQRLEGSTTYTKLLSHHRYQCLDSRSECCMPTHTPLTTQTTQLYICHYQTAHSKYHHQRHFQLNHGCRPPRHYLQPTMIGKNLPINADQWAVSIIKRLY